MSKFIKKVKNGIIPINQEIYCKCKYHGFSPIVVGNTFTLHGYLIFFLFKASKEPTKTSGEEINSHNKAKNAIWDILNPAFDFSKANNILIISKI